VVLIKVLMDIRATGCITQQLNDVIHISDIALLGKSLQNGPQGD
jgi:hypothetical protein